MTPFDYLNAINLTKKNIFAEDPLADKEYVPYIVNRGLSYFPDTVLYANEMNKRYDAPNETRNLVIPRFFTYWDDWNPFIGTGSLPTHASRVSNYWVRGSSIFLSTHTGSATLFSASVDRSSNTSSKVFSVELPMSLTPYSQSSYYRDKYAIFSNAVGNNEDIPSNYRPGASVPGWRTIGIGPTSLNTNQIGRAHV